LADRLKQLRKNLMPANQPKAEQQNSSKQNRLIQNQQTPSVPRFGNSGSVRSAGTGTSRALSNAATASGAAASQADSAILAKQQNGDFKPARRARPHANVVAGTRSQSAANLGGARTRSVAVEKRPNLQQRLSEMQRSTPSSASGASRLSHTLKSGVPTLAKHPETLSVDVTRPANAVARSRKTTVHRAENKPLVVSHPFNNTASNNIVKKVAELPRAKVDSVARETRSGGRSITNDKADHVLIIQHAPQLTTSVTGPKKMSVGQPSDFQVDVRNVGKVDAKDLVVSIRIPAWAEVGGKTPSLGSTRLVEAEDRDEKVLQWHLPLLAGRSDEKLNLKITARESRPVHLAVDWTHAPASSGAVVEVVEPKLTMVVAGPDEMMFGETKVYKLTVSNPGTGVAENVVIRLMSLRPDAEPAANHKLGILRPGEAKQLEIELTAREAGTLQVRAQAEADGGLRVDAQKAVMVLRSDLQIQLGGPETQYAGTEAVYRIRVTNPGTATARKLEITVALPGGAKLLNGSSEAQTSSDRSKVTWQLAALPPGGERLLEVRCLLKQPGQNRLIVSGKADGGLTDSTTATTHVIALADLKLEVSDPSAPVAVGQQAVYEIRILNRGTKAAEQIEVEIFFSEGIEPIGADGAPHRIGQDGQIVFDIIDVIPADGKVVLKIYGQANQPGNHVFRAQVRCRTLDTKLATEETTRFYTDSASGTTGDRQARQPETNTSVE